MTTLSTRRQLMLLAAVTLMIAIATTGWLLTSMPDNVRRMGEASILLATGILAHRRVRQMPEGTPLLLCSTLLSLAITVMAFWR